jgi:hypothetical protein
MCRLIKLSIKVFVGDFVSTSAYGSDTTLKLLDSAPYLLILLVKFEVRGRLCSIV